MTWHEEVLDADARRAAARLAPLVTGNFYLAGGTGLALKLGHRVSLDLDLFSVSDPLGKDKRAEIIAALALQGRCKIMENKDRTLHLRLEETSVSLFHYPYPLLKPTRSWRGLAVASSDDIAAMKLSAVVGRGSRKDFIDLYALSREVGLARLLNCGARKFRDHADFLIQAARALVYFDDAEKEPPPRMLKRIDWSAVKSYFETEVPRLINKKL